MTTAFEHELSQIDEIFTRAARENMTLHAVAGAIRAVIDDDIWVAMIGRFKVEADGRAYWPTPALATAFLILEQLTDRVLSMSWNDFLSLYPFATDWAQESTGRAGHA